VSRHTPLDPGSDQDPVDPASDQDPLDPASDLDPIELDARGLRCPLPVIRLAEAARDAPAGTRIVVLASDPAARHDIPAWCRMRHHELLDLAEVAQVTAQDFDGSPTSAPGRAGSAQTEGVEADGSPAPGLPPAYLRFVVRILPQPANAGGSGSASERSSRAT
jgi:tRNA 2-thiouridine synthesizing protein A